MILSQCCSACEAKPRRKHTADMQQSCETPPANHIAVQTNKDDFQQPSIRGMMLFRDHMMREPLQRRCNSANTTSRSCPECGQLSPHLTQLGFAAPTSGARRLANLRHVFPACGINPMRPDCSGATSDALEAQSETQGLRPSRSTRSAMAERCHCKQLGVRCLAVDCRPQLHMSLAQTLQ